MPEVGYTYTTASPSLQCQPTGIGTGTTSSSSRKDDPETCDGATTNNGLSSVEPLLIRNCLIQQGRKLAQNLLITASQDISSLL